MFKLSYKLFLCLFITLICIGCESKDKEIEDSLIVITSNVENEPPEKFTKSELNNLRSKANSGDSEAQYKLGVAYANGTNLPEDKAKAAYWFRLSAEQGFASAQYNLALRLANGIGVVKNDGEAVFWYTKAEKQGLDDARSNLAMHLYLGRGIDKNKKKQKNYFVFLQLTGTLLHNPI